MRKMNKYVLLLDALERILSLRIYSAYIVGQMKTFFKIIMFSFTRLFIWRKKTDEPGVRICQGQQQGSE